MLLTGEFIDAATAMEYGLINHSVEPDQLEAVTRSLADKIANKPISARRVGKSMFYAQLPRDIDDAYQYAAGVMATNMMEAETVEAVDNFLNKKGVTSSG